MQYYFEVKIEDHLETFLVRAKDVIEAGEKIEAMRASGGWLYALGLPIVEIKRTKIGTVID